jgi:nephrocystin-4
MDYYRKQTKHDQILNKLHQFATTEHVIYPAFGSVEFFEFVITNPYNEPTTVTIISGDSDLCVVTDVQEWRHLKILHQMYNQVEENMFHREDADMTGIKSPQLFLRPKETVYVPLKFQTFRADNGVDNENKQHPALYNNNEKSFTQLGNSAQKVYHPRKCPIEFRAQDGNPIAILMLVVEQQPHLVNQTFRFNVPEHTFLKKTIRLPSPISAMAAASTNLISSSVKFNGTGENGMSRLYFRSSDQNVVCESRPVSFGEPHDIFVKVFNRLSYYFFNNTYLLFKKAPCSASPGVKKFHIVIFADQFLSVPLQVWQVYVHALQRIDITSIQGQTSRFSVILKYFLIL